MHQSLEPPLRVMSLHALLYCERLFYLEEVEEIRVADERVYAGRRLHEEIASPEDGAWETLMLESERLGLRGKCDVLKRRDGRFIPYEHKRGRSFTVDGKSACWPSDRIQTLAYAMLLKEETGQSIPEARVHYHADNVTVKLSVDETGVRDVMAAIERAKELRLDLNRPPVTKNDRLCLKCSLAPVCLPEEERLASLVDWSPVRLFPVDRDRQTLHVIEHGMQVGRSSEAIVVSLGKEKRQNVPIHDLGEVVLHGFSQITTQAVRLCMDNDVGVHWITSGGRYMASLTTPAGKVQRRIRQYEALRDSSFKLRLAKLLAVSKMSAQLRFVLRATRGDSDKREKIKSQANVIREALRGLANASNVDELRGYEGIAGAAYFAAFPCLILDEMKPDLDFSERNRRPPKDRVNALLGFGYALLQTKVMQAILNVGLEPSFGFYHTPRSAAYPLVLDMMELFRVALWDMPLIASINRKQWNPTTDFEIAKEHVWLSEEGRKKAIRIFEERLNDTWKHPVLDYSLTYLRLVELEVRLLEKEWSGQGGLFAKMRLR